MINKYDSFKDLIETNSYDTDKPTLYLSIYEDFFSPLKTKDIVLLELGIHKGGSLLLWRDYFPKGSIVGLDVATVKIEDASNRIKIVQGFQEDCNLLDKIREENAPNGFDIIIDDASHIGILTQTSFWHLFNNHLKTGGIYVIEDWGTGYWDSWPDGQHYNAKLSILKQLINNIFLRNKLKTFHTHTHGMVGFVKTLIDDCGMGDITFPGLGIEPHLDSIIKSIHIFHGQVFVIKK